MQCLDVNGAGQIVDAGFEYAPGVAPCYFVAVTETEAATLAQLLQNPPKPNPLFDLSAQEGALVAVSIIAVWAVAVTFRAIGSFFTHRDDSE